MLTATMAYEYTLEAIKNNAEKFVKEKVLPAVQEAIEDGYFFTDVDFGNLPNLYPVSEEVVDILKGLGYNVDLEFEDGDECHEAHHVMYVDWDRVSTTQNIIPSDEKSVGPSTNTTEGQSEPTDERIAPREAGWLKRLSIDEDEFDFICTSCGYTALFEYSGCTPVASKFCPHCGSRMTNSTMPED